MKRLLHSENCRRANSHNSQRLAKFRAKGVLPDFHFGTDLDETELAIAEGLMKLKAQQKSPLALIGSLSRGLSAKPRPELLKRLGLDQPKDLKEKLMRALLAGNLWIWRDPASRLRSSESRASRDNGHAR